MGGAPSTVRSLWSPEEELQFKLAKITQKRSAELVVKYFFDGVPTKKNKHSQDPLSPVFVQPDDNDALNRAKSGIDDKYFKLVPTTVMLGHDGLIRVIFHEEDLTYNLSLADMESAITELSKSQTIPGPSPPRLHAASRGCLDVYWNLPYPPGIAQVAEVQYSIVYSMGSASYRKKSERMFTSFRGAVCNGSQWLNWSQKRWSDKNFLMDSLQGLDPGTGYMFRMRYRSAMGWSDYSEPSPVFLTKPAVPSKPKPVTCIAKTPNSALLTWKPPQYDNGAPMVGYILEGRSVGDTFVEIYQGPKTSHIEFSLFPEFAYSFRVAAVNSEGPSVFSDMFTIQTPPRLQFRSGSNYAPASRNAGEVSRDIFGGTNTPHPRRLGGDPTLPTSGSEHSSTGVGSSPVMSGYDEAMQCRQAWKQCWDDNSQSFFYFNMMTGVRQRDRPEVWDKQVALVHRSAAAQLGITFEEGKEGDFNNITADENEAESVWALTQEISMDEKKIEKENELRTKKSHLYKSLNASGGGAGRRSSDAESIDVNNPNYPSGKQKLYVSRQNLLLEAFRYIMGASAAQLRSGRLQICFDDEEGIDSGGLSKEFFLLLSRQVKRFSLHPDRQYMIDVDGKAFFKNRIQRSMDTALLSQNGNDGDIAYNPRAKSQIAWEAKLPVELPKANIGVQVISTLDGDEDVAVSRAEFCFFLGRFVGKALFDKHFVDLNLHPILWKHIMGMNLIGHNVPLSEELKSNLAVSMSDLRQLDEGLCSSLFWMLNNSIEGVIDETFSVQIDSTGEMVPLCKNGENMAVTNDNKAEYVDLIIRWRTEFCVKTELDYFVRGFCQIVPRKAIIDSNLTIPELSLILNGKSKVDVEEVRAYTIYQSSKNDRPGAIPFGEHSDNVSWLWMLFRKMDGVEQGKLLLFVTGTSCVPLDGYSPPFSITDGEDMDVDSLPRAHTCFNQIVLPPYSSYEILREKILFAINNTEGFALS